MANFNKKGSELFENNMQYKKEAAESCLESWSEFNSSMWQTIGLN